MITVFHGTTKLFKEFRPQDTIGTGEGKSKFGWDTYLIGCPVCRTKNALDYPCLKC